MSCISKAIAEKGFFFIAEIGQNHQGNEETFRNLIEIAKSAGADAVKSAKRCISSIPKEQYDMPYLNSNSFGETYGEHREALELEISQLRRLREYARSLGLHFGMSFTCERSLYDMLKLDLDFIKVPSSQLVYKDLLKIAAKQNLPIIVSTGMSDIRQVDEAVEYLQDSEYYLMQCTSCYPTKEEDLNLNIIPEFRNRYGCNVGFSGHHVGIDADTIAQSLKAVVFERHITLSRAMKGTDHALSLELSGLEKLIRNLSRYKDILGSNKKKLLQCEIPSMKKLRFQ